MAAIGTALIGKVLGHSEAEKAFRPWWDTIEDNLIYVLVMMGLIVVPTAIIMGTPLDCNFCQTDHCFPNTNAEKNFTDPGFNAWWVKKFCTMNGSVEPFMLYFPYFLLLIALLLFAVERMFLKIFQAGLKLETFYKFLVQENVLTVQQKEENACSIDITDGGKEALELKQSFKGNNNYFASYVVRTVIEILIAGVLLIWICVKGIPVLEHKDTLHCDVHGYWYECSGQPAQFYIYVLYITVGITGLYMVLNTYNLFWLLFPCFGKLSRLMSSYRSMMRAGADPKLSDEEVLGELYSIYYDNRDLRLLLDLLATSSGVAPAIAIMTIFDKKFGDAMKPKILGLSRTTGLNLARVEFQEPKTGVRAALANLPGVNLFYIAEICPPADSAVEGFEFKTVQDRQTLNGKEAGDGIEMTNIATLLADDIGIQAAVFTGLKPEVAYTIKVSTVVNGRTIAMVKQELAPTLTKEEEDEIPAIDADAKSTHSNDSLYPRMNAASGIDPR